MTPTGGASVAGVVGRPIRQSLSPVLHNAWIAAAGLDAVYAPFAVSEGGFERFVEGLRDSGVRGLNVTAPFKARALAAADVSQASARSAGAANLLLFRDDDVLEARNTDGVGLLEALRRQAPGLTVAGARVLILGAGGAARGAAAALLDAGAERVVVLNRSEARAEALAAALGPRLQAGGLGELEGALPAADLVVNATSAELGGGAALDLPWSAASPHLTAMDMTYRPLITSFLAGAQARGLTIVDGLEMLIGQARPSFEAFFGRPPPEALDIRAVALEAMGA